MNMIIKNLFIQQIKAIQHQVDLQDFRQLHTDKVKQIIFLLHYTIPLKLTTFTMFLLILTIVIQLAAVYKIVSTI